MPLRLAQDINELLSTIVAREKSCTIQWVPAHVNIEHRLCDGPRKKWCLPELNLDRVVTTTISRMRTGHMRGMKIIPDGSRNYTECRQALPGSSAGSVASLHCISVASTLFNIDPNCCHDTLYTDKVSDVARTAAACLRPI
ncbi:RNase H domain-containing protein [Trichonephila clavipes]|nr:RNase H domain-containing protein [Trichonephila clavipes]